MAFFGKSTVVVEDDDEGVTLLVNGRL